MGIGDRRGRFALGGGFRAAGWVSHSAPPSGHCAGLPALEGGGATTVRGLRGSGWGMRRRAGTNGPERRTRRPRVGWVHAYSWRPDAGQSPSPPSNQTPVAHSSAAAVVITLRVLGETESVTRAFIQGEDQQAEDYQRDGTRLRNPNPAPTFEKRLHAFGSGQSAP